MVNLIPPPGQQTAKKEYLFRVTSTMGLLFGPVILLLTVAHIPTYVLINAQVQGLEFANGQEMDKDASISEADEAVQRTEVIIERLKTTQRTRSATEILAELETRATTGVTFSTFILNNVQGAGITTAQVQGIAATRSILAQFKNSLEESETFSKVQIPIADLVKDANLPFTITITLAPNI